MASAVARRLIGEAGPALPLDHSDAFVDELVDKGLKPFIRITFHDGAKETIQVPLEWMQDAFMRGNSTYPAMVPKPTPAHLEQIGGPWGVEGGEYAMEVINYSRIEGDETSGVEGEGHWGRETEGLSYRPLEWEYVNEEEEPPTAVT